jgi:hypothetical protein
MGKDALLSEEGGTFTIRVLHDKLQNKIVAIREKSMMPLRDTDNRIASPF